MKPIQTLLALLALGASAGAQAIDAPGGDETDVSGGGAAKVITWEPIITEFYAMAEHGTSAVIQDKLKNSILPQGVRSQDVIGEVNQWRQLKPAIAPRAAGAGYKDEESVLSAWHRSVDQDGRVAFITYGSNTTESKPAEPGAPAPQPGIHTIYSQDHNILFSCDLDILTNANAADKDLMIDHFRVRQFQVTAHKVSDDPKRFRDPVAENAQVVKIRAYAEDLKEYPKYVDQGHAYARPKGGFNIDLLTSGMGETGVWEFRVKAVVEGKMERDAPATTKEVTGAIRVAFVKNKELELRTLYFAGQRKTGEVDDWIITADGRKVPIWKSGTKVKFKKPEDK